jgi:DivIVA domain-containing protein
VTRRLQAWLRGWTRVSWGTVPRAGGGPRQAWRHRTERSAIHTHHTGEDRQLFPVVFTPDLHFRRDRTEGSPVLPHPLASGLRHIRVDELIERIEATLAGAAAPGQAVTANEVRRVQLSTTRLRHGYDQESVDNALDVYGKRLPKR